MSEDDTPDGGGPPPDDGVGRRTLIRLLVGLGIGIPVLVEGLTFLGLLRSRLFGDGSDGGDETATTADDGPEPVAVGGELLPASEPSETLLDVRLVDADGGRRLAVRVAVDNALSTPYEFSLGPVALADGGTVEGVESRTVAAGESAPFTARWDLPDGATPVAVTAVGRVSGESARQYERRVPIDAEG
jgi:hypothetical protein